MLTVILTFLILLGVVIYCYYTGAVYEKFKRYGVRVNAQVVSMQKIGASGTGNTKMKMMLNFSTETGPVNVCVKKYISPQSLIKVMKDNSVIIYYHS